VIGRWPTGATSMTTIITELYDALKDAGAAETVAA
jgi:hypothetical protein